VRKELPKIAAIFFITVGIVIWALNFIFFGPAPKSKATGETIGFFFDPSSVSQASGDFVTSVKIKPSIDMAIRGYQFEITFDKSKIQFKNIQYKAGTVSAGVGDDDSKASVINQNGVIKVVGEIQSTSGQVIAAGQNTEIVAVTFTANSSQSSAITTGLTDAKFFMIKSDYSLSEVPSAGQASFSINTGGSATTTILTITPGGPTLTPIPTVTPGGPTLTPTPTGAVSGNVQLNLKLKFQGILGKPADALNKLNVKVKLYNTTTGQGTDYKTAEFTADAKGIWSGNVGFNVDVNAKYILFVKGPYHLQKKICDAGPTETAGGTYRCTKGNITLKNGNNDLDLSSIVLLVGDLPDQDGTVSSYDTSLIRNNLGKTDDASLANSDVNRDGIVDTQDYSLVIAALSVKNDEE
jgi:hypothetical protein